MTTEPCPTCGSLDGTALWRAIGSNIFDVWHAQDEAPHTAATRCVEKSGRNCTPCTDPCHQSGSTCRGCGNPLTGSTNLLIREADGVEYLWHQECYKPALCPMCEQPREKRGTVSRADPASGRTTGEWEGPCTNPFHAKPQMTPLCKKHPQNGEPCPACLAEEAKPLLTPQPVSDGAVEVARRIIGRLFDLEHHSQRRFVQKETSQAARLIQDLVDKETARLREDCGLF